MNLGYYDYEEERGSWYDTAQVCINGHEVNRCAVSSPKHNAAFCQKCGAKTIQACLACGTPIRGYLHVPNVVDFSGYDVPAHCHSCGKQYPWTEARITAAKELAEELDELTAEEKEALKKSVDDLVADTPRTTVAAIRFKRLAAKGGRAAVDGFKTILTDVLSEAAKKILFPGA